MTRDKPSVTALSRFRRLEGQFLRPHRRTAFLALFGMLLQSLLLLPVPLLQGWVLDQLAAAARTSRPAAAPQESLAVDHASIAWTILAAMAASIACYLGRTALSWKVATTMNRLSLEVVRVLTDAMHRKFQRLPIAYFDCEPTGRVMARMTSDVGSLLLFLSGGALQLVSDLVLALGILAALFWLQWRLALMSLVVVPLYAINHRYFAARLRRLSRAIRGQVTAIYALLSERVSAVRVVRSFAQEEAEIATFDACIDAHKTLACWNLRVGAFLNAFATVISGIGTVAVIAYGALLASENALSVGSLMAFYALLALLYNPVVRLTQFYTTLTATLIAVDRIGEVFEEPEPLRDRPDAQPLRHPRGDLELREVSFAYHRAHRRPERKGNAAAVGRAVALASSPATVLDRINLRIDAGMTVGILGASGSGKSTLLALVPRLYEVPEGCGAVLYDGQDVRTLRSADLRRAAVLVPQQATLFEGTIYSNLTYANPTASAAAIERALQVADLTAMVRNLPRGLETPVGERGFSLSGGQRQRLALARALIADPAVLLLDDCTSAVDAATEARIQAALATLLPGRTRLIVSHNVAALCHADLLVVLSQGRITEQGSHEQLLDLGGWYAKAFAQQMQLMPGGLDFGFSESRNAAHP